MTWKRLRMDLIAILYCNYCCRHDMHRSLPTVMILKPFHSHFFFFFNFILFLAPFKMELSIKCMLLKIKFKSFNPFYFQRKRRPKNVCSPKNCDLFVQVTQVHVFNFLRHLAVAISDSLTLWDHLNDTSLSLTIWNWKSNSNRTNRKRVKQSVSVAWVRNKK